MVPTSTVRFAPQITTMGNWNHNPGSGEAQANGCTCPITDNNHGEWEPWRGWVISLECPLHN